MNTSNSGRVPGKMPGTAGETPNTDDLRIFNRRWTPMNTDKIKASPLHPRPSASICGSILFSSCLSGRYWARRLMPLRFKRTKETKEFLTADYADDADVLRKETPLTSVLSASSAVKKSKFRTPVDLTSNDFQPVP
jgi:hypothetical protein